MGAAGYIAALVERLSVQLPHTVIAASAHTGRLISAELHRVRRVSVNPSGIDTVALARIKPALASCDVLYTGRLVKDKNVDKLVAAIGILAKTNPAIRCLIIGHGVEKPVLEKLISRLKLGSNITLLEPLPLASDVYRSMKAAKVFCLPSVREGFGIVALEALGCGTPVITTNAAANAAKDLIDGTNGYVVSLTPYNLAKAIDLLTAQPKPRGLAKRVAAYDWSALAIRQAEIYAA